MAGKSWGSKRQDDEHAEAALDRERATQQRRQVERELAGQRQRLARAKKKDGRDAPPDTGGLGEPVEDELARIEGTTTQEVVRRARKDANEQDFDTSKPDSPRTGKDRA